MLVSLTGTRATGIGLQPRQRRIARLHVVVVAQRLKHIQLNAPDGHILGGLRRPGRTAWL